MKTIGIAFIGIFFYVGQILVRKEIEGCAKDLSTWLVNRAISKLPDLAKERYQQEWLGDLHVKGDRLISRLRFAIGVNRTASSTRRALATPGTEPLFVFWQVQALAVLLLGCAAALMLPSRAARGVEVFGFGIGLPAVGMLLIYAFGSGGADARRHRWDWTLAGMSLVTIGGPIAVAHFFGGACSQWCPGLMLVFVATTAVLGAVIWLSVMFEWYVVTARVDGLLGGLAAWESEASGRVATRAHLTHRAIVNMTPLGLVATLPVMGMLPSTAPTVATKWAYFCVAGSMAVLFVPRSLAGVRSLELRDPSICVGAWVLCEDGVPALVINAALDGYLVRRFDEAEELVLLPVSKGPRLLRSIKPAECDVSWVKSSITRRDTK